MYRRVVVSHNVFLNGPVDFLYHVRGARLLSQRRVSDRVYEVYLVNTDEVCPVVFADSVRLRMPTGVGEYRTYEIVLDVPENQPAKESVEEITETGVTITVFNENGVVICRNVVKTPANSAPSQTDDHSGTGEMTSESTGGTGEMTSESTGGTGEMTREPIDGTGEMTSEPIDGTGETTSEPIDAPTL